MRADLTDITVVLDRSGSMAACQAEAENGLNRFISEQAKAPGEAIFTLVQFDDVYEFVYKGVLIQDVPKCRLVPRGMTALLDALGKAINETGERLAALPESERPGAVVFVIITDGQENSSQEFKREQIKAMIEHQQSVYNWQFTYLGANQDAFAVANDYGIQAPSVANFTIQQAGATFTAASANTLRMRRAGMTGQTVTSSYTDKEREEMMGK